uniref:Uncharacterized protein n=1 Tax=Chenopodium quinoa TaxID=63459 RepID=A0A803LCI0_CHEQI
MDEQKCSWDDIVVENQNNQVWPDWLPNDWCIHRDISTPENRMSYSNPKGKSFHSMEEVVQYLAKEAMKPVPRQTKRKLNDKVEEQILVEENETPINVNPPQDWPNWLPQDCFTVVLNGRGFNPRKRFFIISISRRRKRRNQGLDEEGEVYCLPTDSSTMMQAEIKL